MLYLGRVTISSNAFCKGPSLLVWAGGSNEILSVGFLQVKALELPMPVLSSCPSLVTLPVLAVYFWVPNGLIAETFKYLLTITCEGVGFAWLFAEAQPWSADTPGTTGSWWRVQSASGSSRQQLCSFYFILIILTFINFTSDHSNSGTIQLLPSDLLLQ